MLHFRNNSLPEPAERFLKEFSVQRSQNTVSLYRAALSHFYRFLTQTKIDIADLNIEYAMEFDEDLARHNLKFVTRKGHARHVHLYLRWLENREEIERGVAKRFFPSYREDRVLKQEASLPELAERFLTVLLAINKKSTVDGYKSCLRAFYRDHFRTGKPCYKIDRADVENFMITMKKRGLGANDRFARLVQFRRYLDWLFEHKKLKIEPDKLITSFDFPQRESSLPRPFPPEVDLEIQRRLWESNEIDRLGLLLQRRCGLRLGEMRNLTTDCLGEDLNGNHFLKVPLGKLNNERIIPLDPKTLEVVEKIKRHHSMRSEPGTDTVYLISNPKGRRRSRNHFAAILLDVTKDLAIPGKVTVHRLRHSFATSLLSAGISITTLKTLLGHKDIRMTLGYAAVTQETVRNEYFAALAKVQARYEVASYPLRTPDLHEGMNRALYDAQKYAKKIAKDRFDIDPKRLSRLLYRLMSLRHELSQILRSPETELEHPQAT